MTAYWTNTASFIDAHIGAKNIVCVSIVDDELASERLAFTKIALFIEGEWHGGGSFKWDVITTTRCQHPIPQYAAIGVQGQVHFVGGGDMHEEVICDGASSPSVLGAIRGAKSIDGQLYVCGMKRQVYKRLDRDRWQFLSEGIPKDSGVFGFEAIDGFTNAEIYAVGWEGEIWQFNGSKWLKRDSGTNVILVDVACAANGQVYVIGRGKKLIIGREDQWQLIDLDLPVELQSIVWFKDELYACSTRDIFTFNGEKFRPIQIDGDRPKTLQYLSVGEGGLCAVGPKDLFKFDGTTWTRID